MNGGLSYVCWMIDAGLTYFVNSFGGKSSLADAAMKSISYAGIPLMVLAVASTWWARSNRVQARFAALSAGLSFLLALALNQVILLMVQRVRPYDAGVTHLLVAPSADPSFPSDHASAAFAIAFAFLFLGRTRIGWALLACAAFLALSRVYIGTHYVGDVMGGVLTALVATLAVVSVYREGGWVNQRLVSLL